MAKVKLYKGMYAIALYDGDEFIGVYDTTQEIATRYGISDNVVKSALCRCLNYGMHIKVEGRLCDVVLIKVRNKKK